MNANDKKIITRLQGAFDAEVKNNSLLRENDRIAVGLSGGIDSLVLLENLVRWRDYFVNSLQIVAVYVDITNIPYATDTRKLQSFCLNKKIDFQIVSKEIKIDSKRAKNNPCFICSWSRRKVLFEFTKKHNFNKLALGHHRDDAIETFLLNLMYRGTISSLPAKLKMFGGRLCLIRPLISTPKDLIVKYAKIKELNPVAKQCPYADKTKRRETGEILKVMKKFVSNPEEKIFKAMRNIFPEYLP